jgi:hypothetical protein
MISTKEDGMISENFTLQRVTSATHSMLEVVLYVQGALHWWRHSCMSSPKGKTVYLIRPNKIITFGEVILHDGDTRSYFYTSTRSDKDMNITTQTLPYLQNLM